MVKKPLECSQTLRGAAMGWMDVSRFPNHANIYQLWDHFHVNASNVSPYFEGESA